MAPLSCLTLAARWSCLRAMLSARVLVARPPPLAAAVGFECPVGRCDLYDGRAVDIVVGDDRVEVTAEVPHPLPVAAVVALAVGAPQPRLDVSADKVRAVTDGWLGLRRERHRHRPRVR